MPRIVVTGAGGFLGSAIVEALLAAHCSVYALTGPGEEASIPARHDVESAAGDICNSALLRRAMRGADAVVHAAGPPSVAASLRDPAEFVRVHVLGTASVVQAMRDEDVPAIVYVSSAEVYAPSDAEFVRETDQLAPRSPYGAAKLGAEAVVRAAEPSYGLRGRILRPFSIYGPRMTAASVLGTIIGQARSGNVVSLADLAPVRDYCFVTDVAEAVVAACLRIPPAMTVMNVSTGIGTSVRELAETVGSVMRRSLDIRVNDAEQRPPATRIARLVGDNTAIREQLQWRPLHCLHCGIDRIVNSPVVA